MKYQKTPISTVQTVSITILVVFLAVFVTPNAAEKSKNYEDVLKRLKERAKYAAKSDGVFEAPFDSSSCCKFHECHKSFKIPPLILISLDGFRDAYMNMNVTPNIQNLFDCGVKSKYMIPSFPSKTFPNHYSIVTGLYPASHGIVDNKFYDPNQPEKIFAKNLQTEGWFLGDPIWNTVQRHDLKSAVFFWPGSEALVNGTRPNYWKRYDSKVPFKDRVDQIIEWLELPEDQRPTLLQVYFEEPDEAGHKTGPFSEDVKKGMEQVDDIIGYLTDRLTQIGLLGCVNIVIVSDHGMQLLNASRIVKFHEYLPDDFDEYLFTGVQARISLKHENTSIEDLMEKMKCLRGENFSAYERKLLPIRYHYSSTPRAGEVLALGDAGVTLVDKKGGKLRKGDHGYDNRIPQMRCIFGGVGPSLAQHKVITPFENIELYNFLTKLVSVDASPNNGTKGRLNSLFRNPQELAAPITSFGQSKCIANRQLKRCNDACPDVETISNEGLSPTIQFTSSTGHECFFSFPEGGVHYNLLHSQLVLVEGVLSIGSFDLGTSHQCTSYIDTITQPCDETLEADMTTISLFFGSKLYNTLDVATLKVSKAFAEGTWKQLANLVEEYVRKYSTLAVFAGPIFDSDSDGIGDSYPSTGKRGDPTHVFVVLMRCSDNKEKDPRLCPSPITLPFVLPIVDEDFNCLKSAEYLFENTARVRDLELLTGLSFFANATIWPIDKAIESRTYVVNELWERN